MANHVAWLRTLGLSQAVTGHLQLDLLFWAKHSSPQRGKKKKQTPKKKTTAEKKTRLISDLTITCLHCKYLLLKSALGEASRMRGVGVAPHCRTDLLGVLAFVAGLTARMSCAKLASNANKYISPTILTSFSFLFTVLSFKLLPIYWSDSLAEFAPHCPSGAPVFRTKTNRRAHPDSSFETKAEEKHSEFILAGNNPQRMMNATKSLSVEFGECATSRAGPGGSVGVPS